MSRINGIWQRKPSNLVVGFDFSGGRITSPTGHSLTLYGNATVAAGTNFLELDGVGDYAVIADADEFSFTNGSGQDTPFTFMTWLYQFTNTYDQALWDKYPECQIFVNNPSSSVKGFGTFITNAAETAWLGKWEVVSPAVNQWVHYALVYSGSETYAGLTLYKNGVAVSGSNFSGGSYTGISNGTTPVKIGSTGTSNRARYAGYRFYRGGLTASEIAQIYNAGAARIALGGTP